MSNCILKVTQERVRKLLSCIGEAYLKIQSGCSHFRVKSTASIAGHIISMENTIENAVRSTLGIFIKIYIQDSVGIFTLN